MQVGQQITEVQNLQSLLADEVGRNLQALQDLRLTADSLQVQIASNLALEVLFSCADLSDLVVG